MLKEIRKRKPKQKKKVPSFLSKVYLLLENEELNDVISWEDEGKLFQIKNHAQFEKRALPLLFKKANYRSFIRQMNMYSFVKKKLKNGTCQFYHKKFRRGNQQTKLMSQQLQIDELMVKYSIHVIIIVIKNQFLVKIDEKRKEMEIKSVEEIVKKLQEKQEIEKKIAESKELMIKKQEENEMLLKKISDITKQYVEAQNSGSRIESRFVNLYYKLKQQESQQLYQQQCQREMQNYYQYMINYQNYLQGLIINTKIEEGSPITNTKPYVKELVKLFNQ